MLKKGYLFSIIIDFFLNIFSNIFGIVILFYFLLFKRTYLRESLSKIEETNIIRQWFKMLLPILLYPSLAVVILLYFNPLFLLILTIGPLLSLIKRLFYAIKIWIQNKEINTLLSQIEINDLELLKNIYAILQFGLEQITFRKSLIFFPNLWVYDHTSELLNKIFEAIDENKKIENKDEMLLNTLMMLYDWIKYEELNIPEQEKNKIRDFIINYVMDKSDEKNQHINIQAEPNYQYQENFETIEKINNKKDEGDNLNVYNEEDQYPDINNINRKEEIKQIINKDIPSVDSTCSTTAELKNPETVQKNKLKSEKMLQPENSERQFKGKMPFGVDAPASGNTEKKENSPFSKYGGVQIGGESSEKGQPQGDTTEERRNYWSKFSD